LLSTLFHVPSRKIARRFCFWSAPTKFGWLPLFSEGPDPDDGHDAKSEGQPVCDPLDQSQNFFHEIAPAAWRWPPNRRFLENKPSADSEHPSRSNNDFSTWAGFFFLRHMSAIDPKLT
jgi:hypothetical protein